MKNAAILGAKATISRVITIREFVLIGADSIITNKHSF